MATFEIMSPEGKKFEINAPDGATREQAFEFFKNNYSSPPVPQPPASNMPVKPNPSFLPQQPTQVPGMGNQMQAEGIASKEKVMKELALVGGDVIGTTVLGALTGGAALPLKMASKFPSFVKWTNRAIPVAGRTAGSVAGTTGGLMAHNMATGQRSSEEEAKKEATLAAGGELITSALGWATKGANQVLFKPLLKSSKDITFGGAAVTNAINKNVKEGITTRGTNFIKEIAPDSFKKNMAKEDNLNIVTAMVREENKVTYNLYREALEDASQTFADGTIPLPNTVKMIRELWEDTTLKMSPTATRLQKENDSLKRFKYPPNSRAALGELVEKDTLDPKRLAYIMATVLQSKGWGRLNPTQQEARELLKETLMKDLEPFKNVVGLKSSADAEYRTMMKFKKIQAIYNKSLTVVNKDTQRKALAPAKLHEEIMLSKSMVLNDPDLAPLWPKLKAEADAAFQASKQIEETTTDVGPGSIWSRGFGGFAANFLFGPKAIVPMELFGASMAWAFLTDAEKNVYKKMLKGAGKGFSFVTRAATKGALRMKGRPLFPQEDERVAP